MHLLLVTHFWRPTEGPPQWRLGRFADAWIKAGHSLTVITPDITTPNEGSAIGEECLQHPVESRRRISVIRVNQSNESHDLRDRIRAQVRTSIATYRAGLAQRGPGRHPDVIVAAVPTLPTAFIGTALAARFRVPLVIDLRDAWPDLLRDAHKWDLGSQQAHSSFSVALRLLARFTVPLMNYSLRRATLIVTTSGDLAELLRKRGYRHVQAIRNAPPPFARVRHTSFQSHSGPPNRELRVLYAGTVGRAQGLGNAIEAATFAQRLGAQLTLRIVGDGAELTQAHDLAHEIGAPVEFFKPVAHSQMDEHYQWCDTTLVHLRDWGGLQATIPSKLTECMFREIPVTVAADGESARIVQETRCGQAVPAMDPVALAEIWTQWFKEGVPPVDKKSTADWLDTFANPHRVGQEFVQYVTKAAAGRSSKTQTSVQHIRSFAHLAHHAAMIGVEDPLHLVLLASRRLPAQLREQAFNIVAAIAPSGILRGFVYYIGDRHTEAVAEFKHAPAGRLKRILGVQLQQGSTGAASRTLRAREAWARGEVRTALSLARRAPLSARRWRSIINVLQPEFYLSYRKNDRLPRLPNSVIDSLSNRDDQTKLRVLHVLTNSLPYTQSGYSIRSQAVLAAQFRAGLDVVAVTRTGYPESIGVFTANPIELIEGIEYVRLSCMKLPPLMTDRLKTHFLHVLAVALTFQPGVIHTTTNYENAIVAQAVAAELHIPWVYETRGEMEKTWLARQKGENHQIAAKSEYYKLLRDTEARLMTEADAVVALSRVQQESHLERGVSADRIRIVPNSVDEAVLNREIVSSHDARDQLGLPQAFTVGTVSSLVDYEGLDTLVQAIALLRSRDIDIRGAIVGDGVSLPELRRTVHQFDLDKFVELPGKVPFEKASDWYDALDVFCVPRKNVEVTRTVTPLKPLQAMARQRPVIVSDLPALTEITTDKGAGLSFEAGSAEQLADAIEKLYRDRAYYRHCADNARVAATQSTWSIAGIRYRKLYAQLREENK